MRAVLFSLAALLSAACGLSTPAAGPVPESWQGFVELYPTSGSLWGVVNSTDFAVDYEIRSLGTILLVNPEGRLVFRSSLRLLEAEFRQLLGLMAG